MKLWNRVGLLISQKMLVEANRKDSRVVCLHDIVSGKKTDLLCNLRIM